MSRDEIKSIFESILHNIQLTSDIRGIVARPGTPEKSEAPSVASLITNACQIYPPEVKKRIEDEFFGHGPLTQVLADPTCTEIIVNGPQSIWIERKGRLEPLDDVFLSSLSFKNYVDRLSQSIGVPLTLNSPFASGVLDQHRVQIATGPCSFGSTSVVMRRRAPQNWSFDRLVAGGWCLQEHCEILQTLVNARENILVVGGTGSGKTTVLQSLLKFVPDWERLLILEDTEELSLPNFASHKLLTREDPQGVLTNISLDQIIRHSLRMRPDRLVVGEVRGGEAKDLLMALATGHQGSFCTLHANSAHEALLRLEMLIQMGAPTWSLTSIRRLLSLTVNVVVVTERGSDGHRRLKQLARVRGYEEMGLLLEDVIGVQMGSLLSRSSLNASPR